jgi:hypothetical protein
VLLVVGIFMMAYGFMLPRLKKKVVAVA